MTGWKRWLGAAGLLVIAGGAGAESVWDRPTGSDNQPLNITVYRAASCGCCKGWIEHLQKQGFTVNDVVREDVSPVKDQHGVPDHARSCHTALIDGYVIEGHVPAGDIKRLLQERPAVRGLAVPGMVTGTPGMEMGERRDPFMVISFDGHGEMWPYREYVDY